MLKFCHFFTSLKCLLFKLLFDYYYYFFNMPFRGLSLWLGGKDSACNVEYARDVGFIPGSGRYPGGGNGNPLQYFCLGNPMDRVIWCATIHRITQNQTQLCNWANTPLLENHDVILVLENTYFVFFSFN